MGARSLAATTLATGSCAQPRRSDVDVHARTQQSEQHCSESSNMGGLSPGFPQAQWGLIRRNRERASFKPGNSNLAWLVGSG